jgi:hypothetical protein
MKLLLIVEDTFQVTGRGLVVAPDVPDAIPRADFADIVMIAPKDAPAFNARAEFVWTHFRPGGMKLLLTFPELSKDAVPVGSRILLCDDIDDPLDGGE